MTAIAGEPAMLKLKVVVVGMGADPGPSNFPGFHLTDGAISIADSHCIEIIRALEFSKAKRGMLWIVEPEMIVFPSELSCLRRERREELPEPRCGIRLHR